MSEGVFRIHPAIGFARVGTSEEHYIAPETLAGHPSGEGPVTGGLPVRPGTEDETIRSSELRDASGALKRQAARFRVYRYASREQETYPNGEAGTEIQIGTEIEMGGARRKVVDIVWTVHLANKKTAWFESADDDGIAAWRDGKTPPLRNPQQGKDPSDPSRLRKLITDPGPRAIKGSEGGSIRFDAATTASYWKDGSGITEIADYPKTFPGDAFPEINPPGVEPIDCLGELQTEEKGRLLVVGGFGRANSFNQEGPEYGFVDSVNNDWWFDDTGDGPVTAVLVLDDGSVQEVQGGAWVISTDPAYAPQILNVVSLWDDIHDSWVRKLDLRPNLFANGAFVSDYQPSFEDEVKPVFLAAGLQRWITNLNVLGISAHARVAAIGAGDAPSESQLHGLGLVRNPDDPNPSGDDRRMPLSLGDSGKSLLSLSKTQYFYLKRWDAGQATAERIALGSGETLDKAALVAGLGGRFSPGIDMTYICREPDLYVKDWRTSGGGPFRINRRKLSYDEVGGPPFLSLGWTPLRGDSGAGLEPGDISKFMAIPWHADYNSCATHLPAPNPEFNNTLYWSWPAQRPVAVYVARDVKENEGKLASQRFSVRGPGTRTRPRDPEHPPPFGPADPAEVGRYQESVDGDPGIIRILDHWMNIGTVVQATNIDDGYEYDKSFYLEVESRLQDDDSDDVQPWPNTVKPGSDDS